MWKEVSVSAVPISQTSGISQITPRQTESTVTRRERMSFAVYVFFIVILLLSYA